MTMYDRLLTADEVAAELRVTKAWVYAQTRALQLPHVRLGRYVRYRQTAIDAWLEQLDRPSTRHLPTAAGVRKHAKTERNLR